MTPILDLDGLYKIGKDTIPAAHLQRGIEAAGRIIPRDRFGNPATGRSARVVVLTPGMSNHRQQMAAWWKFFRQQYGLGGPLSFVNAGKPTLDARKMADEINIYLAWVDGLLTGRRLGWPQVQVLIVKNSVARQTKHGLDAAEDLRLRLEFIINAILQRAINVQQVIILSANYSGYSTSPTRKEDVAYYEGYGVRDLVLNRMSQPGPWFAWGAYYWANGLTPRSDGLIWERQDFAAKDGLHPADPGLAKTTSLLMDYFKTNPAVTPWIMPALEAKR